MGREKFNRDLTFGRRAEAVVAAALFNGGCLVGMDNSNARRDLHVIRRGRAVSVEVKCEDRHATTGNLCIEFSQGPDVARRLSGISLSEADVTVHTLGDLAALYRTHPMRVRLGQLCKDGELTVLPFAGSDNENRGVILPLARLKGQPWCEVIDLARIANSRVWDAACPVWPAG